jgi:hypothetical protein
MIRPALTVDCSKNGAKYGIVINLISIEKQAAD